MEKWKFITKMPMELYDFITLQDFTKFRKHT